jgi:hypothetical protein
MKGFVFSVISCSSPLVANNIMVTECLHGR